MAADLCQLKGSVYLVVVDYFSRFIEVQEMTSTTAVNIIKVLKSMFSRYGIPAVLLTNGLAERSVKTVKDLLKNCGDPYLALLAYRATPLPWCHFSPAQLLMGRNIRTDVAQVKSQFIPDWSFLQKFIEAEKKHKQKQKENYDSRKRVRPLPLLEDNTPVWVNTQDRQVPGTVARAANTPRSYFVNTPAGQVRRNRRDLRPRQPARGEDSTEVEPENDSHTIMTRSRTGTRVHPPDRYTY